ncbi:restriction endonuclease subunit S [Enterobacter sp. JMULE2]|uniref:restriction endonuclease subunit S n=1 Tax=Enterobacter sp. JMULE2 TaxID=2518340 RepID=UPI001575DE00|nr:restriction endonuclease subunit S [Enterobacter sp. JMULE2]NTZ39627.1 restriction endonuclease subunit S [Enterobacter sp. JMULE2]
MSSNLTYSLGDVADVYDGPHATPKKLEQGDAIFLSISSLEQGRLNLEQSSYISEEDYIKWTRRVTPQPGDVVFSYETKIGEASIIPEGLRCCLGRRMGLLRAKRNKVTPDFLLYAYLSPAFQEVIREKTIHGSTTDRLSIKEIPSFKIQIPDIRKQNEIIKILKAIDGRLELNQQVNKTLEQIAQALFKSWFVDFEPVKAKIAVLEAGGSQKEATLAAMTAISGKDADAMVFFEREYPEQYAELKATAELFPSAMQEGALGATPTGWKLGCIGDISHRIRTKVGSTSAVVLSAIASGDLVPSDEHFTKQVYSKSIEKYILVEQWSFAYNPSRINIGSIGLNVRNVNGAVSPVYVVFKTEQEYKWYVEILTKTTYFKNNVNILASGSVRQSLSYDDLSSIPLCIPDVSIVNVFNEKYEGYLTFIKQYRNQNNTLISIRDTLLPKLLSGEITLPEAEQAVSEAENV